MRPPFSLRPLRQALWPALLALLLGPGATAHAQAAPVFPVGMKAPLPLVAWNWPTNSCPAPTGVLEQAVWPVLLRYDATDVSCGNRLSGLRPLPYDKAGGTDAISLLLQQIRAARSEVLISNMVWDNGPGNPGYFVMEALRDLYASMKKDPAAYPDGMTVRLSVGWPFSPGFDSVARQMVRDLRSLNVPLRDDSVGWQVEFAVYPYAIHSHAKMYVIDGEHVEAGGYNLSAWYLPASEPGGHDLHDLGLSLSGPVGRAGVAAFDDIWLHSRRLVCPPLIPANQVAKSKQCVLTAVTNAMHPPSSMTPRREGNDFAAVLYRRVGHIQADEVQLALLKTAQKTIDLMHADFSTNINCLYAFKAPDDCDPSTFTPYFKEVIHAAERGVNIRVITVNYDIGQLWNRSGIALMRQELRRRGLEDRFEVRHTKFKMHTKASLYDHHLLVVGSINFHFSSWGPGMLTEMSVLTNSAQAAEQQANYFDEVWNSDQLSQPVPPEPWLKDIPLPAAPRQ